MNVFKYLSTLAVPMIILIIVIYGCIEKQKVYDAFLDGAKEGIEIVFKIFPTLIGIFIAVGALRSSGILDLITGAISPVIALFHIPKEIMPLVMIKPISGSASIAVATDILQKYGVDSKIGFITSTIMGSTETTFYVIALYSGAVGVKKTRFALPAALIADLASVLIAVVICSFLS